MQIDKEIKSLIPSLTSSEFESLETSIKKEGCRHALVIWKEENILLDGHHRYKICKNHKIKFQIQYESFPNKNKAKIWVIINQFSSGRNLTLWKRANLAINLKPLIATQAKERQGTSGKGIYGGKPLNLNSKEAVGRTNEQLGEIAGISTDTIWKVEYIANKAASEILEKLNQEEITINKAYTTTKSENKETTKTPKLPKGKYNVIYADPPWQYNVGKQHGEAGTTQETTLSTHYPSMSIEEICDLPVPDIVAKNAVLFLWATSPLVWSQEAFQVIDSWGFEAKACFVWDKIKHNVGHYNSVRHEFLIIAIKGSYPLHHKKLYDSVQSIKRTKHSKKPEKFREIINDIYCKGKRPYIDLFGRGKAPKGWIFWGTEAK